MVSKILKARPQTTRFELAKQTGASASICGRYKTAWNKKNQILRNGKLSKKALETKSDEKCVYDTHFQIGKSLNINLSRKFNLVVGLPDIHLPFSARQMLAPSARAAISFCADVKPDEIIVMGDYLDLACISHWNKKRPGRVEGQYLIRDLNIGNLVLDILSSTTAKITYLEGNHEVWLRDYEDEDPGGRRGIYGLNEKLRLYDRKIDLIPENGVYKVGKANVIHGWYQGIYHARQTVEAATEPIFYGHTHDIQCFSKTKRPGSDPIIGHSCGCLCDRNPHYLRNKPNRWAAGFLILEIRDDGTFTYAVPQIVAGRFIWNGKEYAA